MSDFLIQMLAEGIKSKIARDDYEKKLAMEQSQQTLENAMKLRQVTTNYGTPGYVPTPYVPGKEMEFMMENAQGLGYEHPAMKGPQYQMQIGAKSAAEMAAIEARAKKEEEKLKTINKMPPSPTVKYQEGEKNKRAAMVKKGNVYNWSNRQNSPSWQKYYLASYNAQMEDKIISGLTESEIVENARRAADSAWGAEQKTTKGKETLKKTPIKPPTKTPSKGKAQKKTYLPPTGNWASRDPDKVATLTTTLLSQGVAPSKIEQMMYEARINPRDYQDIIYG